MILMVYVDDILLYGSESIRITETKAHLHRHFVTKNLGQPEYLIGIEIARSTMRNYSLSEKICYRYIGKNWTHWG